MYIAFKWLLTLACFMWFTLCYIEETKNRYKHRYESIQQLQATSTSLDLQSSAQHANFGLPLIAFLNFTVFLFGAMSVLVCTRRSQIVVLYKNSIINTRGVLSRSNLIAIKASLIESSKPLLQFLLPYYESTKIFLLYLRELAVKLILILRNKWEEEQKGWKLSEILINKLARLKEERDNMMYVLMAAMEANKSIRKQYHLESTSTKRLVKYMADSNTQLKENRAIYMNFRRLYVLYHHENIILRARLKDAIAERDDAKELLKRLIKEIFKSNNNTKLKLFCTRFAGDTYVLNADCNTVEKVETPTSSKDRLDEDDHISFYPKSKTHLNEVESMLICQKSKINLNEDESRKSKSLIGLSSDEDSVSKLINPTGRDVPKQYRYIWTVQNKKGLIENVYEYVDGADSTTRENVKRIRQYSVYHNKDCILDLSNPSVCDYTLDSPIIEFPTNPKFLTGSEAFQNFLKRYNNRVTMAPEIKRLQS